MSDELRNQINDIIEGEIQLGINEFLEEKQRKESDQGMPLQLQLESTCISSLDFCLSPNK